MTSLVLTNEQSGQLASSDTAPPRVLDPTTKLSYVLVPTEEYETIQALLDEERQRRAIAAVARRNAAGRMSERP